jgi:hypothetical protein
MDTASGVSHVTSSFASTSIQENPFRKPAAVETSSDTLTPLIFPTQLDVDDDFEIESLDPPTPSGVNLPPQPVPAQSPPPEKRKLFPDPYSKLSTKEREVLCIIMEEDQKSESSLYSQSLQQHRGVAQATLIQRLGFRQGSGAVKYVRLELKYINAT